MINEIMKRLSELPNVTLSDGQEYIQLYDAMETVKRALEQEPKYCDRNICMANEYNNIGCDECEVTKSQESCEDAISREELLKAIKIWTSTESVGDDYKYIKSVSKPTGIEFDEEQEQLDFVQSHKSIPVKLKVEPSGDLISRQEAIKAIDEKAKRIKNADTLNGLAGAVGILFDLPSYNSINSELSEDAISRQAVLDLLEDTNNGWIINEVLQLPFVKPQEPTDENLHREREQAYMQGYEDASKRFRQEPCEDAISRDAVLEKAVYTETEEGWSGYTVDVDYIKSLPSVKPQEKTGHWTLHNEGYFDESYVCSKCDGDSPFDYKYCPYCGAKMD